MDSQNTYNSFCQGKKHRTQRYSPYEIKVENPMDGEHFEESRGYYCQAQEVLPGITMPQQFASHSIKLESQTSSRTQSITSTSKEMDNMGSSVFTEIPTLVQPEAAVPFPPSIVNEILKMGEMLKTIMNKLSAIEEKIDRFAKLVVGVETRTTETTKPTLITSVEDLVAYEKIIKEKQDEFYKVVTFVGGIGGSSLSVCLKRAWSYYLTLGVKANCNWEGKPRKGTQKHPLKNSSLTDAIFKGILATDQFRETKQFELEIGTKNILKGAPELFRRTNSNLNKENEEGDIQDNDSR